jgi:GNAT superfamily N-acetyltransferase
VCVGEREMPEHDAQARTELLLQLLHDRVRSGAMGALEVAVLDQRHGSFGGPAHVVARAHRRDRGIAHVAIMRAHPRGRHDVERSACHTFDVTSSPTLATLRLRRARFEDVPALLRLIAGAIERGCRQHYDPGQRRAVFLGYAGSLFVDVIGPYDTVVAEQDGGPDRRLAGVAQIDPSDGRLRALFVAAEQQGMGLGRALLTASERLARAHGLNQLHGAMALNASSFYASAGFEPYAGHERLLSKGVYVPVVPMWKALG